jgi:predicted lipoprotein with Yx(FWY)xxD motif
MRNTRITIAVVGAIAAATIGGVTIAGTAGGSTPKHPSASSAAPSNPAPVASATPTVRTATAVVAGSTESILVDPKGLPLYIYEPDTSTTSHVTGQLAALWPPLIASAPTASTDITGTLHEVATTNGQQVSYNGHFLYTFVEDSPGRVTGHGVQNFFVATPSLAPGAGSTAPGNTTPTAVGNGY